MNNARGPTLRAWTIGVVLVAFGLTASGYLLLRGFAVLDTTRSAPPDLCSILFLGSCDPALADPRSWILGAPLAGWGLVYFTFLAGLLLLARFVEGRFETHALLAASAVTALGAGVGVALTVGAVLQRTPLCPLCLAIHAANLASWFALRRAIDLPVIEQSRRVAAAAKSLFARGAAESESSRWQLVGFASVMLLAAVVYQWVFVEATLRRAAAAPTADRAAAFAAWQASPAEMLPVSANDPHLGPLTAPVRLVVFESLRCAHCRRFAATVASLRRTFGDRLLVTFKHYPLSIPCNDRLTVDAQPGACELAWAAEAAHRQARFWPFHDALMAAGATPADLARTVRELGLDPVQFESDRHSAGVQQRVASDVALGNRLKIPGTPAIFLDGRLVRSPTAGNLEALIRHELEQAPAKSKPGDRANSESGRPQREGPPLSGG